MMTVLLSLTIIKAITSVFKTSDTSSADLYQNLDTTNEVASSSDTMEFTKPLLEILLGIIVMFAAGLIGGWIGVALKKALK
ncbi:MAG: hypothetical protein Kow0019_12490 [Methanobacteriaceae archaeon]